MDILFAFAKIAFLLLFLDILFNIVKFVGSYLTCFLILILLLILVLYIKEIYTIITNIKIQKKSKIKSFISLKSVCKILIGIFLICTFIPFFQKAVDQSEKDYNKFYGEQASHYESEIYDEYKIRIYIVPALHFNFIELGLILITSGGSNAICHAYDI